MWAILIGFALEIVSSISGPGFNGKKKQYYKVEVIKKAKTDTTYQKVWVVEWQMSMHTNWLDGSVWNSLKVTN